MHYNVIPNATPKKSELLKDILTFFFSYLILRIFRHQTYCCEKLIETETEETVQISQSMRVRQHTVPVSKSSVASQNEGYPHLAQVRTLLFSCTGQRLEESTALTCYILGFERDCLDTSMQAVKSWTKTWTFIKKILSFISSIIPAP